MDVVVPLISAAVGGLVAWLVTLHQSTTGREIWVLDKRFAVYSEVVDAQLLLVRRTHEIDATTWAGVQRTLLDLEVRHRVLNALTKPDLIAPDTNREKATRCVNLLWMVVAGDASAEMLFTEMDQLVDLLRDDLVPKSLRRLPHGDTSASAVNRRSISDLCQPPR